MKVVQYLAPTFEPISLSELKLHLRLDSGSFSSNIDETQLIPPAVHIVNAGYTLFYELLTLDVAPGGAGWAAGDTLTGATSTKACVVVEKLTALTYIVKNRTGVFTLGEHISNGTADADQGTAYPTFTPAKVEVLGYQAVVTLEAGTFTTGTLDVKIQDSDDGATWNDWPASTPNAFAQVSTANDNQTFKVAYTGTRRYIRTAGYIQTAVCPFSTTVIRLNPMFAEDDLLNAIIVAAREHVEDITRRQIITATWYYYLQNWPGRTGYRGIPSRDYSGGGMFMLNNNSYLESYYIKIPFGNLQTITSVKWKDSAGTEYILVEDVDYIVEKNGNQCGKIVLPYGVVWPTGMLWPSNPITIEFVCGWTTAALVPSNIKSAIKLAAEDLYYHGDRSDILDDVIEKLLSSYRLWEEF